MRNGRCRSHGGKSTGPRTEAGIQRLREARTVHGYYGEDGRAFRRTVAALFAQGRWLRQLGAPRNAVDAVPGRISFAPEGDAS